MHEPSRNRRGLSVDRSRAVQAGTAIAIPKAHNGMMECIRVLRAATKSMKCQFNQINSQMRHLIEAAPEPIRVELQTLSPLKHPEKATNYRPGKELADITTATKTAQRVQAHPCRNLATKAKHLSI